MFWGFCRKFTFSSSLSHYEQKSESTFGGEFLVGPSNCYESRGTFWRETFFLRKLRKKIRLPDFERFFLRILAKKFQQLCQNCNLRLQRSVSILFLEKRNFFSSFSDFICQKFSIFRRKRFGKLVKNANWMSRGWIQEKMFFEED